MRRRPVLGGRCRNSTTADTKYCGCTARGCGAMKVHFWHGQFCCSEVDLFSYFHCSSTYFLIFEAGKIKLSLQSVGMRLIICVCTANTRFAATTFYCCSSEIMAKPIYRPTVKQKQHFDCLLPRPEVSTIVCNYQRSCLNKHVSNKNRWLPNLYRLHSSLSDVHLHARRISHLTLVVITTSTPPGVACLEGNSSHAERSLSCQMDSGELVFDPDEFVIYGYARCKKGEKKENGDGREKIGNYWWPMVDKWEMVIESWLDQTHRWEEVYLSTCVTCLFI